MRGDQLGSWLLATTMVLFGCAESNREETEGNGQGSMARAQESVPPGEILELSLDQELSLATTKPGDSFTAKVISPVVREGKTLIESGAPVRGKVTAVQHWPGAEGKKTLAFEVREIEVHGRIHMLRASILEAQTEIRPRSDRETASAKSAPATREDTAPEMREAQAAAKDAAATGAPAQAAAPEGTPGAVADAGHSAAEPLEGALGALVSVPKEAAQSAASGAAVEKAIVMETPDGIAVLPAGSLIRVRLERGLELAVMMEAH